MYRKYLYTTYHRSYYNVIYRVIKARLEHLVLLDRRDPQAPLVPVAQQEHPEAMEHLATMEMTGRQELTDTQ